MKQKNACLFVVCGLFAIIAYNPNLSYCAEGGSPGETQEDFPPDMVPNNWQSGQGGPGQGGTGQGGTGMMPGPRNGPRGHGTGMPHGQGSALERLSQKLFSAEEIRAAQAEIGLTEKQQSEIVKEISASQKQMVELEWNRSKGPDDIGKIIDLPKIDEGEALKLADKLLDSEKAAAKTKFSLLIKLKNTLTKEQQEKLLKRRQMTTKMGGHRMGHGAGMGPRGGDPMRGR